MLRAVRADARLTASFDKGEEGQAEKTLLERLRTETTTVVGDGATFPSFTAKIANC